MARNDADTRHPARAPQEPCRPGWAQADARSILSHALERVLPEPALRRCVSLDAEANALTVAGRTYDLSRYQRILVVGGGKAARRTAAELVRILGDRITAGVLNVYLEPMRGTAERAPIPPLRSGQWPACGRRGSRLCYSSDRPQEQGREPAFGRIRLFAGGHPIPNEEGVKGAREMVALLRRADAGTLVMALISGGGSSLMALPAEGVSLEDYREVSRLLLTVPATIDEINAVRKHIDPLKGGGMRKAAAGAGALISLVLSDVPVTRTGIVDDPSVIASGPTVGDDSTFEMAKRALAEHGIWDRSPRAVREYIQANVGREEKETLRRDSPLLAEDRSQYVIMANNDQAMEAAGERAEQLGYTARIVGYGTGTTDGKIQGEVTQAIESVWKVLAPCLAAGDQVTLASFSTDGIDGSSDLAGAIADTDTLRLAAGLGLDYTGYLSRYDSATFFHELGLGIETGPTGTNVADIILVLVTNPAVPHRRTALIFGGEATVKVDMPVGEEPGQGGRNTHLVLLAVERLVQLQHGGSAGD